MIQPGPRKSLKLRTRAQPRPPDTERSCCNRRPRRGSDSAPIGKRSGTLLPPLVNLSLEYCTASSGKGEPVMFSSRDAFENDFCPVRDELLGEMYRANANGLPLLVESVSSEVRAMLALFCYRRSHLHALAIAIAASCTERELISSAAVSVPRSTRCRASRPRVPRRRLPTAAASRSRCRPSRFRRSSRSRMSLTTKISRKL